ncbi:MAG: hypothetical protein LBF83_04385 [Spirochaetaceae bacterium]|nr:hypothetical protein [Spirochaetaceae bacterium]
METSVSAPTSIKKRSFVRLKPEKLQDCETTNRVVEQVYSLVLLSRFGFVDRLFPPHFSIFDIEIDRHNDKGEDSAYAQTNHKGILNCPIENTG